MYEAIKNLNVDKIVFKFLRDTRELQTWTLKCDTVYLFIEKEKSITS